MINIFAIGTVGAQSSEKLPVIIQFNGKSDAALIRAHGGDIKYEYSIISAIACSLPEQAIEALQRNPNIEKIEPDHEIYAVEDTLDWGVDRIDAEVVNAWGNTGEGIKVAVLDTGIDYTHVDLDDNYMGGIDFVNGDNDPLDDNGHGTHCAGTIAAEDNGVGVIGVAPGADVYAVKVLDSTGGGVESNLIAAIDWAVTHEINVISMSLGSDGATNSLETICNTAEAAGVLLIAAAGNDYRATGRREVDTVDYPGRFDSVIAVGATDQYNNKASFSSTGPDVEISAPGVNILSTYPGGYATGSGTSMATPHVAGVAALVFASGVETASEVRTRLQTTADDLGDTGRDNWYGYGLVDAEEAAEVSIPDTTNPVISGVELSEITLSSATITWTTDELSDSLVNYGLTTELGTVTSETSKVTSHSVTLTGLISDTTYYFEVQSTDSSGNTAIDNIGGSYYSVTTLTPDTTAPDQVTGLTVVAASSSQLDLTWNSNTEADLEYYNVYRDGIVIATTSTNSFSDTELSALTTYHYSVSAVDTSGNEGDVSDVLSATTLETPPTPEIISEIIEVTEHTRTAGKNVFYWATATVKVTTADNNPIESATVYGHWEGATSDTETGTTDNNGFVSFTSNSVKNPSAQLTFTFVIDNVVLL